MHERHIKKHPIDKWQLIPCMLCNTIFRKLQRILVGFIHSRRIAEHIAGELIKKQYKSKTFARRRRHR